MTHRRDGTDWKTARKGIVITVTDTGIGMSRYTQSRIAVQARSPSSQSKLFAPFFTTKGDRGNGLRLRISREIVDRNRGVLAVRSFQAADLSGTVFVLFLPRVDAEPALRPQGSPAGAGLI
jgi:signal transduction histidine kinase